VREGEIGLKGKRGGREKGECEWKVVERGREEREGKG